MHSPTGDTSALKAGLAAAIAACGSKAALLRKINAITGRPMTDAALCQWEFVPLERVTDVARASGIPKHILRPDQHDPPVVIIKHECAAQQA